MKKKIYVLSTALCLAIVAMAQSSSMLSFGLRGGGNTYLTDGAAKSQIGYGGLFDIAYTYYKQTNNTTEVGFRFGVSAGYCTNGFTGGVDRKFTNTDYLGNKINYTITSPSAVQRITQQINVEVPLMLAIRAKQVFINVGAKFMMPIISTYEQDMTGTIIDAYYPKHDVHVTNRLITGVTDNGIVKGSNCLPKYNVLVGLELGYEWIVNDQHRIGLGVYGDISPWSSFQASDATQAVDVAPITNPAYPVAQVTINPLCTSRATVLLYSDFGIKFYYGINWSKN